jgi:recombination protein RecT
MSITTQKDNPIEKLRGQLQAMTPEFANALPSHIKPEKFQRVVMTVVQLQPDLLNADRRSLLASCIKCAADGLVPDGREAALVLFGGKVQYMPMFTGIQKRVRNSGEVSSLQAHVIYENDKFIWKQGATADIVHEPLFPGDRGKPVGAYAIAKFKDGSDPQIEVMDITAIERVRAVSRAAKNGPWVQWYDEMARKTVFRRLSKWLPMDSEVETLMRRDDEIGTPQMVASQTIDGVAEPAGKLDALEATAVEIEEGNGDGWPGPDTKAVA